MARAGRGSHPFLSRLPTAGERAAPRQKLGPSAHGPRRAPSGPPMQLCPREAMRRRLRGAPEPRRARCAPPLTRGAGARATPTARPAGPHCPRRHGDPAAHAPSPRPPRARRPTGCDRQTFSSVLRRGRLPHSARQAGARRVEPRGSLPQPHPGGRRPGRAPIHSRRPRRSRTWPWLMVGPASRALTWLEQRRRRPQGAGSAHPG